MDPQHTHAFVIKIWLERREIQEGQPEWRGRIDHVQSNRRKYFRDLADMTRFVESFLTLADGAPPGDGDALDQGEEPREDSHA